MSPPRDDDSPSGDGDVAGADERPASDGDSVDSDGSPGSSAESPPDSPGGDDDRPQAGESDGNYREESTSGPDIDAARDDEASRGAEVDSHAESERPAETDGDAGTSGWQTFAYDVVSSAVAVLLVGLFLFAVSGVWPPMVAVESQSMYPHMEKGDLVFVMDEERFPGDGSYADTGVVPASAGEDVGYWQFSQPGDVIIYEPNGNGGQTPIIHRAMFWVNESEDWYEKADRQAIGSASDCSELSNCPAPHAGFVTKGDANRIYDQARGLSRPVKSDWVVGTAEASVPKLGCIRLRNEDCIELQSLSLLGNESVVGLP